MFVFCCVLCFSPLLKGSLCSACTEDLWRLRLPSGCERCGLPQTDRICGQCLKSPPAFDRTYAALIYEDPLRLLIKKFKYERHWQLAEVLSRFAPALPTADLVIPIPLFKKREQQRGFNQACELAKCWRKKSTVVLNVLSREKDSPPQAGLNYEQRRRSVKSAFSVQSSVKNLSIVLVDDVMTSGATLHEAAKTLKAAGAREVQNFVIARAVVN